MRRALAVAAAIVVLGAAIVALAPATLAGVAVLRASGGLVTLADTEGTIWRGHATVAAGRVLRLPVVWTVDPVPLLRGRLRVSVAPASPGAASPRATVELDRGGFEARDIDLALPAAALSALAPKLGLAPDGELRLAGPSLGRSAGGWSGGVRAEWHGARIGPPGGIAIDLGDVVAMLAADGGRLAGPIANAGGDVEMRGNLAVGATGALEGSASVVPRRDDPALASALSVLRFAGGPFAIDVRAR